MQKGLPENHRADLIQTLFYLKAVLQRNGAVKYQMFLGRILVIYAEITLTQELEGSRSLCIFEALFYLTAGENLERVRVHAGEVVLTRSIRICIVKQICILTNLSIAAVVCVHPVDGCALDFTAVCRVTAAGLRAPNINKKPTLLGSASLSYAVSDRSELLCLSLFCCWSLNCWSLNCWSCLNSLLRATTSCLLSRLLC